MGDGGVRDGGWRGERWGGGGGGVRDGGVRDGWLVFRCLRIDFFQSLSDFICHRSLAICNYGCLTIKI